MGRYIGEILLGEAKGGILFLDNDFTLNDVERVRVKRINVSQK